MCQRSNTGEPQPLRSIADISRMHYDAEPMDADEARRQRAAARSSVSIRRVSLADESSPDVSHLDRSERIALVWQVTLDAWASSGRSIPDYARADAPGKMIRGVHDAT